MSNRNEMQKLQIDIHQIMKSAQKTATVNFII